MPIKVVSGKYYLEEKNLRSLFEFFLQGFIERPGRGDEMRTYEPKFGPLIGSSDYTEHGFGGGHIGVFVGSRSQRVLAPTIADWLKARA